MPDRLWQPVDAALDRAAEAGRTVDVWLRDDDAVAVTPALDRLVRICEEHDVPVLLAVIPEQAQDELSAFVDTHPLVRPTQHGFRHTNHAATGERARELGGPRDRAAVVGDLERGRDRIAGLFGRRDARILVPPWNRIDPDVVALLPGLGYAALSTFGAPADPFPITQLNCDLDIIDWRKGRVCRPVGWLIETLATLITVHAPMSRPIGLLTHHLVHDAAAWRFLEDGLGHLRRHSAVRFRDAPGLLADL